MKTGIFSLFFAAAVLVGCKNAQTDKSANATTTTTTTTAATVAAKVLSVDEFSANMAKMDKKDYYLIDVRTKAEFEAGALPDALNIDFNADGFEAELAKLDKSKTAFIYCQAGGRSAKACKVAEKLAFKSVFDMAGGYGDWSAKK
jgi:phage shock protein E